jgi:hypothetical protein
MHVTRIIAASTLSVGLIVTAAGPAMADDLRYVGPKKVVVNQAYENVSWRVAGGDTPYLESVDATLEHVSTREESGFDYAESAPWSGTFQFYDWERMGRYQIHGEAYDYDYNDMSVAPTYVMIKRAASMSFSATRSAGRVTLRTTTKKYLGSYPRWAAHRGATLRFQRFTNGAWRTFATRKVANNGINTVRTRAPKRSYRVVIAETGTVWGKTSGVRRR